MINVTRPVRAPHTEAPSLVWVNEMETPSLSMILSYQSKIGGCFWAECSILNETPGNPQEKHNQDLDDNPGMNITRS